MSASHDIRLAIVIPAYKAEFLRATIQSIARQTDQCFQLYVGDDASPAPIAEIVREFSGELPVKYHRFKTNLGSVSLVQQWERCIRLTAEPWVWLFSDDDFMDAGCVAAFFAELEHTGGAHDAYRFNSAWVNGGGQPLPANPLHPKSQTGADFLLARLRGHNASNMQELIFSRQAWESSGGIPDFPLAWTADDAFIAKLGARYPIRTIFGPRVHWRASDLNISSDQSDSTLSRKLKASRLFMEWVGEFFENQRPADHKISRKELNRLAEAWFFKHLSAPWNFLNLRTCWEVDRLAVRLWERKTGHGFLKAQRSNWALASAKIAGRWARTPVGRA